MSAETWNLLRAVFEQALDLEGEERQVYLDEACAGDSKLRQAVCSLLEADEEAGGFLEKPVVERDGEAGWSALGSPSASVLAATLPKKSSVLDSSGDLRLTDAETTLGELQRLGPYRVVRRLGQGGMGVVYLAVRDDDSFQRRVVIKLVRRDLDDADLLRRLRTERQILASLDHPSIARLYDGGATAEGRPYFVMEYIEGLPIDRYCDDHRLNLEERLELFVKICSAVQYAHQNLVVHRDIKPSNILVDATGEPKLLDFGIAKVLNPELAASNDLEPTATWHRLLTPQYASPEQVRGKLVTTSSDVYSLGVLLFKLLTGLHPHAFGNHSAAEIERILTHEEPPRPSTLARLESTAERISPPSVEERARQRSLAPEELAQELEGDLDAIVQKALRPAPQKRYGSPEKLADDLERYALGLPVEARQGTLRYRASRFIKRQRFKLAFASVLAALVIVFVSVLVAKSAEVVFERDQARSERAQRDIVLDLMLDIFRVADPYYGDGEALTLREALEASREPMRRRLRNQPGLLAELLHTTGTIYTNLGLWARAKGDLEEALEIRLALHDPGHAEVASSRGALGLVLAELGEDEKAVQMTRASLASARQAVLESGEDPAVHETGAMLLKALDQHITALCIAGTYKEAEPLAEEAVRLARQHPDTGVDELADAWFNVGSVELRIGHNGDAAESFRRSLGLYETIYGQTHPHLAVLLNNLGSSLNRSGDLSGAEQAFSRSVTIIRERLNPEHASLSPMLNNLAGIQLAKGDIAGAIKSWLELQDLMSKTVGNEHPRMLFVQLRINSARVEQGNALEVLRDLDVLVPAWLERLDAGHRFMLMADRVRAEALIALGRVDEGRSLLEATIVRLRESDFVHDLEIAVETLAKLDEIDLDQSEPARRF